MKLQVAWTVALAAVAPLCATADETSTIFAPARYTHSPETGERVAQYCPEAPAYCLIDDTYLESGYRHNETVIGLDHTHIVQTWGRGDSIRPYGEWLYPYRPGATPYSAWGNQPGPWATQFGSRHDQFGQWNRGNQQGPQWPNQPQQGWQPMPPPNWQPGGPPAPGGANPLGGANPWGAGQQPWGAQGSQQPPPGQ
jgi:hypothetical protein